MGPGELVRRSRRVGLGLLVESEARLAGILLEYEIPARPGRIAAERGSSLSAKPANTTSGATSPRNIGASRDAASSVPIGVRARGVDRRRRITAQQFAADEQHELAGRRRGGACQGRAAPHVDIGGMSDSVSGVPRWPRVPELAERCAGQVGRELAPQQLAAELVVEADHVGLDHPRRRLQQRDAVGLECSTPGQEQLRRDLAAARRTSARRTRAGAHRRQWVRARPRACRRRRSAASRAPARSSRARADQQPACERLRRHRGPRVSTAGDAWPSTVIVTIPIGAPAGGDIAIRRPPAGNRSGRVAPRRAARSCPAGWRADASRPTRPPRARGSRAVPRRRSASRPRSRVRRLRHRQQLRRRHLLQVALMSTPPSSRASCARRSSALASRLLQPGPMRAPSAAPGAR